MIWAYASPGFPSLSRASGGWLSTAGAATRRDHGADATTADALQESSAAERTNGRVDRWNDG